MNLNFLKNLLLKGKLTVEGSAEIGTSNIATGTSSFAQGLEVTASNTNSHAEGNGTTASGLNSHAEGYLTVASGDNSHAEGNTTAATALGSHAEGNRTATGKRINYSAYTYSTQVFTFTPDTSAEFNYVTPGTVLKGYDSDFLGDYFTFTVLNRSTVTGNITALEDVIGGNSNNGFIINNSGEYAHVEGFESIASGLYSHAEGDYTEASGEASHAEGASTIASGDYSHAEGASTIASGNRSHAEGRYSEAKGNTSHAAGYGATAGHNYSYVWSDGELGTREPNLSSTREGQYVIDATGGVYIPRNVGIGTDNNSNALTVVGTVSTSNMVITSTGAIKINEDNGDRDLQIGSQTVDFLIGTDASTSRVCINHSTNAPAGTLDIRSTNNVPCLVVNANTLVSDFKIGSSTVDHMLYGAANNSRIGINTNTPAGALHVVRNGASAANGPVLIVNADNKDADFQFGSQTTDFLLFGDASANTIGINTSAPNERLTVVGNISATQTVFASGLSINTPAASAVFVLQGRDTLGNKNTIFVDSLNREILSFTNRGTLVITGRTNSNMLSLESDQSINPNLMRMQIPGSVNYQYFGVGTNGYVFLNTSGNATSPMLVIENNEFGGQGRVGIGTGSGVPNERLTVVGNISATGSGIFTNLSASGNITAPNQTASTGSSVLTRDLTDARYYPWSPAAHCFGPIGNFSVTNAALGPYMMQSRADSTFSFLWGTNNSPAYSLPFFCNNGKSLSTVRINHTAGTNSNASATLEVGLYAANSSGLPDTFIDKVAFSLSATGSKTATLAAPYTPTGLFWVLVRPVSGDTDFKDVTKGGNGTSLAVMGYGNGYNLWAAQFFGFGVDSSGPTQFHGSLMPRRAFNSTPLPTSSILSQIEVPQTANSGLPCVILY